MLMGIVLTCSSIAPRRREYFGIQDYQAICSGAAPGLPLQNTLSEHALASLIAATTLFLTESSSEPQLMLSLSDVIRLTATGEPEERVLIEGS
jgi:hypothetical protein